MMLQDPLFRNFKKCLQKRGTQDKGYKDYDGVTHIKLKAFYIVDIGFCTPPLSDNKKEADGGLPLGIIIAIIIIAFIVLFIIVDVTCFYTRHCGVLKCIRDKLDSGAGAETGRKEADAEKGDPETEKLMSGKEEKVEGEEPKGTPQDGPIPEEEEPKEMEPEDKEEKISPVIEKPEAEVAEEAKPDQPSAETAPPAGESTTPSGGDETNIPGEDKPKTPTE